MRLPKDFFSYYSFGLPTHFASIVQRPDGFRIDRDCRRLMEWKPNGTMRLHPFELIQQESGIQVRYRYDWHIGAIPERYTYDKAGQKQPLNELALDLAPGEMCIRDSKKGVNQLFACAVQHPNLHPAMERYARLAMREFELSLIHISVRWQDERLCTSKSRQFYIRT